MKKTRLLLLIAVLSSGIRSEVRAQINQQADTFYYEQDTVVREGSNLSYQVEMDARMEHLNKDRIPFSALYDRVYSFADLKHGRDRDTINTSFFVQAVSEIQRSDYNLNIEDGQWNYKILKEFIYSENRNYKIPLLVLNSSFASIDSAAFNDGRITVKNGMMYDGGNTASPYVVNKAKAAVLGIDGELENGERYLLQFDPGYVFGNDDSRIVRINIADEATGETWQLNEGASEVPVRFDRAGAHTLTIGIELSSGDHILIKQKFHVGLLKATGVCEDSLTATSYISYQGMGENAHSYGLGNYKIYYSTQFGCSGTLNKPIIILDGFDPGDKRKISNIYETSLKYSAAGVDHNLGDELRANGYDVIILNFPKVKTGQTVFHFPFPWSPTTLTIDHYRDGGADYIERNAYILVKLIDTINLQLANNGSAEKLVVIGPSMGGQISRYALAHMEFFGKNHNTRLWVSFDSPHHGANIPYGMQEMIRVLYKKLEMEDARSFYEDQLRSPAAREMLIHQTYPDGIQFGNSNSIMQMMLNKENQEPLRTNWRVLLNFIGFPNNVRRVSVVNGTSKGGQYHTPGNSMFFLTADSKNTGIRLLMARPYFMDVTMKKLVDVWKFGSGTIYSLSTHTSLPYKALDASPGGMYDVQEEFYRATDFSVTGQDINVPWPFGWARAYVKEMTHNISFIPTVSGLAMNNPNFDWRTPLYKPDILCDNRTPFHNVFIPDQNEDHTKLTEKNVKWITQEIYKGQMGCPPISCATSIGGGTYFLYPGQSSTYSLSGGYTATSWSVSGNLILLSSNSTSATVQSTGSGFKLITAMVVNPCGADDEVIYVPPPYIKLAPEQSGDITVYPNPSDDVWNVSIANGEQHSSLSAVVFDLKGQKVWEHEAGGYVSHLGINNTSLAKGIYTLKLSIDGNVSYFKLLK